MSSSSYLSIWVFPILMFLSSFMMLFLLIERSFSNMCYPDLLSFLAGDENSKAFRNGFVSLDSTNVWLCSFSSLLDSV